MKDNKTQAFIGLNGILADLTVLCDLDANASEIAKTKNGKPISIAFDVTDGPCGTLKFANGKCEYVKGEICGKITCKLFSPDHLNQMVDGKKTPMPIKGFTKIGFLLNNFTKLTDILSTYLKASDEALADRDFFEKSTVLMFHLIISAISEIANNDKIGKVSAARVKDGVISVGIEGKAYAYIVVKDHIFTTYHLKHENPDACMIFSDLDTARGLFTGLFDSMTCLAQGKIRISGFVPMVDNLNKILARVAVYLA